jgi:Response regulator containing CheY-like receiver domain and AraC-type DNA-binding domain
MNILLVDDEDYVLDYLETEMPWQDLGISEVHRAESAKQAMDIAARVPLSIVISDIRMPERSGLELLSSLQRHSPETKVVMLSGYSDFSYAVKALQHGASDYLLKPVTEEEVTACLRKIIVKIVEETKRRERLNSASAVLKLGLGRMREHLLLDLLMGKKYSSDELRSHLQALHLPLEPDSRCALSLIRVEARADVHSREDYELLSYAVLNMAEETLYGEIRETSPLWFGKDHHRFIIAVVPVDNDGLYEEKLRQFAGLHRNVSGYLKQTVSIVLTPPFALQASLQQRYTEALNALWRHAGTRSDRFLPIRELADGGGATESATKSLSRLHQSPALRQLMELGQWDEAVSRLDYILEELDMPACGTKQHVMEMIYYLFSSFSFLAHKQGDSFADMVDIARFQHEATYYHSTAQIRELALSVMEQFKRSLQEVSSHRNHIIRQVHEFIDQHLKEDVSLTRVGEHVYLHPVYLSRLYKKETGESLSAYITRIRMEKAAQLLTSTNMKVADIALEVGYQKTQYFIHIFKEFYSCTPQNYRNR